MAGTCFLYNRRPDSSSINSPELFAWAVDRFDGSVNLLPCLRCQSKYQLSGGPCSCIFRGARGFYLKTGSKVVCSFSALANIHKCTGSQLRRQHTEQDNFTNIPCNLVICEDVDSINLCAVRCTRAGCANQVGDPRNVNAKHLLNKAHTVIYGLPIFLRACRKRETIAKFRAQGSGTVGDIPLSSYYIDGPSLDPQPGGSPNLHDLYLDIHEGRLATWGWASTLARVCATCLAFKHGVSFTELAKVALGGPSPRWRGSCPDLEGCCGVLGTLPFMQVGKIRIRRFTPVRRFTTSPLQGDPDIWINWAFPGQYTVQRNLRFDKDRLELPSPGNKLHFMMIGMGHRLIPWTRGAPLRLLLDSFDLRSNEEVQCLVLTSLRMGRIQELIPPLILENPKLRTFEHEIYIQVSRAVSQARDITVQGGDAICRTICLERGRAIFLLFKERDLRAHLVNSTSEPIRMVIAADAFAKTGLLMNLRDAASLEDYTHIRDRCTPYVCLAHPLTYPIMNDWLSHNFGQRFSLADCPDRLIAKSVLPSMHCCSYGLLSSLVLDAWQRLSEKYGGHLTNCLMLQVVWC